MRYLAGRWYESKAMVRAEYGEYWKGILLGRRGRIAVVFSYLGARRKHYGDRFDHVKQEITYIGEGKRGDQQLNPRNEALVEAAKSGKEVDVFLDCGDLLKPKRLLCAGKWSVSSAAYQRRDSRRVFVFKLCPAKREVGEFLRFTFGAVGSDPGFERDLRSFSRARERFYSRNLGILRARDNILGEIGEYFAVKHFNRKHRLPAIRLAATFKDIDAIQIKSGKRLAIKTVGAFPGTTSSIWSKTPADEIDAFLICHLDREHLTPRFICQISASKAVDLLRRDQYQGSRKLRVDAELLRRSILLYGDKRPWLKSPGRS